MQGFHGDKHWNQTCVKIHGDYNYTIPEASSPHFFLRKHEPKERTCQYGKSGSQHGSCHGDQRRSRKTGKLKYLLVIFKMDSFWNQGNQTVGT